MKRTYRMKHKYHQINWVLTDSEFTQYQALRLILQKKYPDWTIQKWFTTNFQELAKENGVIYMQQHESNFIHKHSISFECQACKKIAQRKLPGKDLELAIYQNICDECLRKEFQISGLWTDKHEKKYQLIYKGVMPNVG